MFFSIVVNRQANFMIFYLFYDILSILYFPNNIEHLGDYLVIDINGKLVHCKYC